MKEEEVRILREEEKKQDRLKARLAALEQTQLEIGRKNDEEERNLSDDQIRELQKKKSESLKNLQEEKQSLISTLSKTPEQRTAERLAEMERERAQNNKTKDKVAEGTIPTQQPRNVAVTNPAIRGRLEEEYTSLKNKLSELASLKKKHPILTGKGKWHELARDFVSFVSPAIELISIKLAKKIERVCNLDSEVFDIAHKLSKVHDTIYNHTVEQPQDIVKANELNMLGEKLADRSIQVHEQGSSDQSKTPTPTTFKGIPVRKVKPMSKNTNTR